jgi:hypothetical protein
MREISGSGAFLFITVLLLYVVNIFEFHQRQCQPEAAYFFLIFHFVYYFILFLIKLM